MLRLRCHCWSRSRKPHLLLCSWSPTPFPWTRCCYATQKGTTNSMAVYFDHRIQSDGVSASSAVHHAIAWHPYFSVLAVASKDENNDADGCVNFYLDEVRTRCALIRYRYIIFPQGELVEDASIQRSVSVQCMQWHPEKKIIAIGWRSGEITVYNGQENAFYEQSSIHKEAISVLSWNQDGTRLISGDQSGLLVVWKAEGKGQLHPSPLYQHRLHAALTHCTMQHPAQSR